MVSSAVVFYKIATTGLLILVGYIARRMKLLPEISVSVLSKFIIYISLPAYFIYHMPMSVSRETLGHAWFFPLLGFMLVALSDAFGYASARLLAGPGELATFRMVVMLPNWVFMGLAVCDPLFPGDGVRVILLYNLGIVFYLWTFGMTSFRSGVGPLEVLRHLFLNVQTIALFIGLFLALAFPGLKGLDKLTSAELGALPYHIGILTPFWETLGFLGNTALPLSIVQIGLLLGSPRTESQRLQVMNGTENRSLGLTIILRLLIGPLLLTGVLALAIKLGVPLTLNEFIISVIVMSMPAAVVCLTIADVFGGTSRLAAKAILWQTVASLATAPIMTMVAEKVYSIFLKGGVIP